MTITPLHKDEGEPTRRGRHTSTHGRGRANQARSPHQYSGTRESQPGEVATPVLRDEGEQSSKAPSTPRATARVPTPLSPTPALTKTARKLSATTCRCKGGGGEDAGWGPLRSPLCTSLACGMGTLAVALGVFSIMYNKTMKHATSTPIHIYREENATGFLPSKRCQKITVQNATDLQHSALYAILDRP